MILYNLIIVLNPEETHVLMCLRAKDPYLGKYNMVGGFIEAGEEYLYSAYRELEEETGITRNDIELHRFMDFTWYPVNMEMKVFIGRLSHIVPLQEEVHRLDWIPLDTNFFDTDRFAGEGNIGHMIEIYRQTRGTYFD